MSTHKRKNLAVDVNNNNKRPALESSSSSSFLSPSSSSSSSLTIPNSFSSPFALSALAGGGVAACFLSFLTNADLVSLYYSCRAAQDALRSNQPGMIPFWANKRRELGLPPLKTNQTKRLGMDDKLLLHHIKSAAHTQTIRQYKREVSRMTQDVRSLESAEAKFHSALNIMASDYPAEMRSYRQKITTRLDLKDFEDEVHRKCKELQDTSTQLSSLYSKLDETKKRLREAELRQFIWKVLSSKHKVMMTKKCAICSKVINGKPRLRVTCLRRCKHVVYSCHRCSGRKSDTKLTTELDRWLPLTCGRSNPDPPKEESEESDLSQLSSSSESDDFLS